jgi:conjugative relaxase-like TrwC/TraI family protein
VVPYLVDGRHPGRWSPGATRLLGLAGAVERRPLRRVLEGRDPSSGASLPLLRRGDRRPGWGLVFSAPKSVSLMAAGDPDIAEAHVAAVEAVLGYLESRLRLQRVDVDNRPLEAEGLVAASFDHATNAGSEPHLHTHVVVPNVSRSGHKWGAVHSADWQLDRGALAALFDLELRHQLGERGWPLDWRLRPDGLADIAEVPSAAVRAASVQGRRAAADGRFAARRTATAQPWAARASEAGFVAPERAGRRPDQPSLDDPHLERAVTLRVTSQRSDFRRSDVIETLASCWPAGATISTATEWADRFCEKSLPVPSPTTQPRWTTSASRRLDDELVRMLRERRPSGVCVMGAEPGRSDLLAQAETIAAARDRWDRAGLRVAVSTLDPVAETRWAVLAGLHGFRPGDRPDVLVVDRADRRPSADLIRLVRGHEGDLVFVEGGTLPRLTNPASHGMVEAADQLGRLTVGPHLPWGTSSDLGLEPGPMVGRRAADALLQGWRAAGDEAVMVALGLEEVHALNRAAVGSERSERGVERFQPGDRVVVMRSRPDLPPFGTFGTVGERADHAVRFDWSGGDRTVTSDRRALAAVDFGYAVSPGLAAGLDRPLFVLGPAAALSRGRERVVAEVEVTRHGSERGRGIGGAAD